MVLLACSFQTANARQIMGLNFCGTVSVAEIKKSIEKNNASVSEEKTDEETGEITIVTKDYKVADIENEISFGIYKNKLYKIKFEDSGKVDDLLGAKYGIIRSEQSDTAFTVNKLFYYNIQIKDVDLFVNYSKFQPSLGLSAGPWSNATYLCKPINKLLSAEIDRLKKKKELQKKGVDKL